MVTPIRQPVVVPDPPEVSFEDLYEQHRHSVYRWARRYCGADPAEAEDLTQEVFIKLLSCITEIEAARAGAWLYRVTANLAISRGRARRSVLNRLSTLFFGAQPLAHPADTIEARDELVRALEILGRLPPRERVIINMKLVDGLSQFQIAAALGLSQGYVSKLLTRATARLRDHGCEVTDD
jgi:RNA polymerase sigma factor (sigma-70 family)